MTLKTENVDLKIIREMKQEEDHTSIILVAMHVQCNAKMIGLESMAHEPWTTLVRITQPKVLTQDNAWQYRRNWNHPNADTYYAHNYLTDERRPITQQQYQ